MKTWKKNQNESITAFKQNKNIQKIIGIHWIENVRVKKDLKTLKEGKCTPCWSKAGNICCKKVKKTTFKSHKTNQTWKIFHNTNCKTECAIYLMECTISNLQYVGKKETPFNTRLSNYRKTIKDPKTILADKHFQKKVIDLMNTKEILRECLIQRENFWIQKLKTLYPKGLNQEFNMQI